MFSRAVSVGTRLNAWKTKPIRSRRSSVIALSSSEPRSTSAESTSPEVSRSRPARQCSSVDLPDPDGPMIAVNCAGREVRGDPVERPDRRRAGAVDLDAADDARGARMMLDAGATQVEAMPSSSLPPLPGPLQEYLGVAPELVRAVAAASEFVVVRTSYPPGWPPMHEWAGRACAAVLASQAGVPLVDTAMPKVLTADAALRTLPGSEDARFRLADWMLVFQSAGIGGLWMTTKGLGRFGLPELQVRNVPPQLGNAWTHVLTGLASSLLGVWLNALRDRAEPAFAQLPAVLEVGEADIARAYDAPVTGGPAAPVRLTFDPSPQDGADSFLSVQPPDDYPASAGEFLAGVCTALFGQHGHEIRYLPPSDEMERAMQAAREALPAVRARFLAGDLPPRAQLMIKHEISVPGQTEYPWAYVTSWADPARVLGNSAGDAALDPGIRPAARSSSPPRRLLTGQSGSTGGASWKAARPT